MSDAFPFAQVSLEIENLILCNIVCLYIYYRFCTYYTYYRGVLINLDFILYIYI